MTQLVFFVIQFFFDRLIVGLFNVHRLQTDIVHENREADNYQYVQMKIGSDQHKRKQEAGQKKDVERGSQQGHLEGRIEVREEAQPLGVEQLRRGQGQR